MTMTPGEMLTRLYDELIKQLNAFKEFNHQKDYAHANDSLQRAQRILRHLDDTLDHQYEVSQGLSALYDYFIRQSIMANLHKDDAPIDEIIPMWSCATALCRQIDWPGTANNEQIFLPTAGGSPARWGVIFRTE